MDTAAYLATRRSLHAIAELVLAGPQYRQHGDIRLAVTPGGFATVTGPRVRVDGTDLAVDGRRWPLDGQTCAALADGAGLQASALGDVYRDGTDVRLDETLRVDPIVTAWLARCWAAGDAALRKLAPAEQPVLWPEHFDVAIRVDQTNFGISPGDEFLPEPYAYVGPPEPREGEFWNQPFGAARPIRELAGRAAADVEPVTGGRGLRVDRAGRRRGVACGGDPAVGVGDRGDRAAAGVGGVERVVGAGDPDRSDH
ncbi:hypothetical protein [Actinoplanes subtropicus]|uniref:hypothetical protein n=1 Tax=Actinoplanes subtropicus TaxID=543632 RepID=UPI0007C4E435|nr:hypothetical protein [Actinoplanes subtropicus]